MIRLFLLLVAGCLASIWDAKGVEANVKLIDSNALVDDTSLQWLDNRQVFFRGFKQGGALNDRKPIRTNLYSLHIWDVVSNRLTRVSRMMSNLLCASDGNVAFYAPDPKLPTGDWVLFVGKYGSERNTGITRQAVNSHRAWLNPISCETHTTEPLWIKLSPSYDNVKFLAATKPMKENHGFIHVAPGGTNSSTKQGEYEVIFYRASDGKKITLFQHSNDEARGVALRLSYVPFIDKYLLSGSTKLVGEGIAPAWLISPTGNVQAISPATVPTPGADNYLLSKAGILYPYTRIAGRLDTTLSGLWLIRGREVERVIVGIVRGPVVSPDGCKVAFSHAIHHQAHYGGLENLSKGEAGYTTLKMIDLCVEGRGK